MASLAVNQPNMSLFPYIKHTYNCARSLNWTVCIEFKKKTECVALDSLSLVWWIVPGMRVCEFPKGWGSPQNDRHMHKMGTVWGNKESIEWMKHDSELIPCFLLFFSPNPCTTLPLLNHHRTSLLPADPKSPPCYKRTNTSQSPMNQKPVS